jgi:alanine dehydrogenase
MTPPRTIGFPRMKKEAAERRVFLPDFIQFLAEHGVVVVIEEGYGSRSGFTFDDYQQGNPLIRFGSREEAFAQDAVLVLRSPTQEEFNLIPRGTVLISMLHYPTRPKRFEALCNHGIRAISLDSIVDDHNLRLVENMTAVAWNGLEAGFDVLERIWPGLNRPDGKPIEVLVLGTGMVGRYAVDAATHLGNIERNNEHIRAGGRGAIATAVGRNLSHDAEIMQTLMQRADVLVDATQRRDTSRPVVPNSWIDWLPDHAVVVDLAVDPYILTVSPPVVRGVEGIPQGDLNQYVFHPQDPTWNKTVPVEVDSRCRRTTVTCYSWPGIHPEACMHHYALQLEPLMEVLLQVGYEGLSLQGNFFARALYRATLDAWSAGYYRVIHAR